MKILDIEIDEAIFKKLIIASLILIFIYGALTVVSYAMLEPYTLETETTVNDDEIRTGISVLNQGTKKLKIEGWAYKTGQSIEKFNSSFVLKNKETGKMYLIKTAMQTVEELRTVDGVYDCSKAGMSAECIIAGLDNGIYDICILYKNDNENVFAETAITLQVQ